VHAYDKVAAANGEIGPEVRLPVLSLGRRCKDGQEIGKLGCALVAIRLSLHVSDIPDNDPKTRHV
jgi:hypothetical protein